MTGVLDLFALGLWAVLNALCSGDVPGKKKIPPWRRDSSSLRTDSGEV